MCFCWCIWCGWWGSQFVKVTWHKTKSITDGNFKNRSFKIRSMICVGIIQMCFSKDRINFSKYVLQVCIYYISKLTHSHICQKKKTNLTITITGMTWRTSNPKLPIIVSIQAVEWEDLWSNINVMGYPFPYIRCLFKVAVPYQKGV